MTTWTPSMPTVLPAAAVRPGDTVRRKRSQRLLRVTRVRHADPTPGQVTWELAEGAPVALGAAELVTLHPGAPS